MQEVVETSAREIRMRKTEGRRSKRGKRGEERKKRKKEEGEDSGS